MPTTAHIGSRKHVRFNADSNLIINTFKAVYWAPLGVFMHVFLTTATLGPPRSKGQFNGTEAMSSREAMTELAHRGVFGSPEIYRCWWRDRRVARARAENFGPSEIARALHVRYGWRSH